MKVKNKQIKVLSNKLRDAKERISELETVNTDLERKKKNITKKYKELKKRDESQISMMSTYSPH